MLKINFEESMNPIKSKLLEENIKISFFNCMQNYVEYYKMEWTFSLTIL